MLLKSIFVLALTLPVAAASDAPEIFEGQWNDSTKIEWICPPKTVGTIPFRVTSPGGKVYHGMLSCGESV